MHGLTLVVTFDLYKRSMYIVDSMLDSHDVLYVVF